jgi:hypothetical protein
MEAGGLSAAGEGNYPAWDEKRLIRPGAVTIQQCRRCAKEVWPLYMGYAARPMTKQMRCCWIVTGEERKDGAEPIGSAGSALPSTLRL